MKKIIRVLIVDDSVLIRKVLSEGLSRSPNIEVVGTAANPFIARDKIVETKPDVMTLDIEMPKMDGVEFLRRLMPQFPIPTIIVSSLTPKGGKITLDALDAGAIDFITKPSTNISRGLGEMIGDLVKKIETAAKTDVSGWKNKPLQKRPKKETVALAKSTDKVIAIGASTGGTVAIQKVLETLPITIPGIVIVQHMPGGFTQSFASRLNDLFDLDIKEAETNDRIYPGRVLIAAGDRHLTVKRSGGNYLTICREGEKVRGHCPSVDVLFHSVAKQVGSNAVGVVLTGMGNDGASGLRAMRNAGARCISQDEKTSVVFGMPNEAYKSGGAERLVPLNLISKNIVNLLLEEEGKVH